MESSRLSVGELNAAALDHFVYQPVSRTMIEYLAKAADAVIACDKHIMPSHTPEPKGHGLPPTPPRTPEPREVLPEDGDLPTLEEFITQLVVSSNVQVPTLMSTLVYLNRLKSKLQPMARGLRCTTHRIFLASLILAAKYLNDSSPKNKHWASYSHIRSESYNFGFSRTEVNLMEKQLLFLLDWDLRITEEDLYRELDRFLDPIRREILAKHQRRMARREEAQRRKRELYTAAASYPSPPSSRGNSRSPRAAPPTTEEARSSRSSAGSVSPPGLSYGSSASSYASSTASSSRQNSRATTPLDTEVSQDPYMYVSNGSLYESPVEIVLEPPVSKTKRTSDKMLPYEISPEELRNLESKKRARTGRGVWGRVFGGAVTVR
jgi:PHO85 cyclin-1